MEGLRPLSSPGLAARAAPFAAIMVLAYVLVPLPPQAGDKGDVVLAGALTAVIFAAAAALPWRRLPAWAEAAPPLAYLVVVALLREAEGGAVSAFGPLAFLPVLWLALYGTRGELLVAVAAVVPVFVVPAAVVGGAAYPATEIEHTLLSLAFALALGVSVQALVQQIRLHNASLREESLTDDLTGVLNRRAWDEMLEGRLRDALDTNQHVCLAMIDMDHLKLVNDTYGHQAGSLLLRRAASAWQAALREADALARYGGDEFAVLLPGTSLADGVRTAQRLLAATPPGATCSIGVAVWEAGEDAEHFLGRADAALYEAKRSGRGRIAIGGEGAEAAVSLLAFDRRTVFRGV